MCVYHLLFYMFATYLFSVFRTHAAPAPPLPGRNNRRTDSPKEQTRTPPRKRRKDTPQEQRDRDRQGTEGQRPPRSQGKLKLRIFSIFTLVKLIRLRCVCHLLFYMFATYLLSVFRTHAAPAPTPLEGRADGRRSRHTDTPKEQTEGQPPGAEGQTPARNQGKQKLCIFLIFTYFS